MEGGFGGLKSIVWGSDKGTSGHHRVLSPRGRVWEGIRDPQEEIFFVGVGGVPTLLSIPNGWGWPRSGLSPALTHPVISPRT